MNTRQVRQLEIIWINKIRIRCFGTRTHWWAMAHWNKTLRDWSRELVNGYIWVCILYKRSWFPVMAHSYRRAGVSEQRPSAAHHLLFLSATSPCTGRLRIMYKIRPTVSSLMTPWSAERRPRPPWLCHRIQTHSEFLLLAEQWDVSTPSLSEGETQLHVAARLCAWSGQLCVGLPVFYGILTCLLWYLLMCSCGRFIMARVHIHLYLNSSSFMTSLSEAFFF